MENPQNSTVLGKLFYSAIESAVTSEPKLFASALAASHCEKVFADEALVSSCMSLFNNDLNVSLAAEKLYMHRNTLIYRIKKIRKITGLDVTKFADAVNFIVLFRAYKNRQAKN